MVDCWAIHHPLLDFHGAGGRGHRPWRCQGAPLSRTGADGPYAEEYTMADDAHRITPVPCDKKGFFVFLAKALKKTTVCPVVRKSPAKFCTFDFYSISLILLCDFLLYVFYIETLPVPQTISRQNY